MRKIIVGFMLGWLSISLMACGNNSLSDSDKETVSVEQESEKGTATDEKQVEDDVSAAEDGTGSKVESDKEEDEPEDAEINKGVQDKLTSEEDMDLQDAESSNESSEEQVKYIHEPFYGIWVGASPEEGAMEQLQKEAVENGFDAHIFVTTDWDNLSDKKLYVLAAGVYTTEEVAKEDLPEVQNVYADAYIKYSGEYVSEMSNVENSSSGDSSTNDSTSRINITITLADDVNIQDGQVEIAAKDQNYETINLVADQNTVFAPKCDMQFFAHYEPGMSVLDWMDVAQRAMKADETDYSLVGVYDVDVTGNHIDKIYGIYWWD